MQQCEEQIGELEAAVKLLEDRMATAEGASDITLYERHASLKKQLDTVVEEWEQASIDLEEAQAEV